MLDFFRHLFDTTGFWPRAQCGNWTTGLILLHVISDCCIWLAYLAIPALLLYFVRHCRQLPFSFIFLMFGAFIVSCGFTHLMDAIVFYAPLYRLAGLLKVVTALVSLATVCALIPLVPRVLSLLSPTELEHEMAERLRAEQELADSSEFTRQIVSNAREGIVVFDRHMRCKAWNPFMEELSGLPVAAVLGKHPLELGGFFQDQETDALMESALAGQVVFCRDVPYAIPDTGHTGWCSPQLAPLRDSRREIVGIIATVRDVTERKAVEQDLQQLGEKLEQRVVERTAELARSNEALRESEERFRLAVEAAPNGMIMVEPSGSIVLTNSQVVKLFGYSREELHGQPVEMLVPQRWRGAHPAHRAGFVAAPQTRPMGAGRDLFGQHKDGSEVAIEIGLNPIPTEHGVFVLASIIDITARKQAELALQRAKEAAEAANRAKSEFLANVSHEIRTPLNGILGMTELLLGTELSIRQREYLQLVQQSSDSLLLVINELLDFARIEAHKLQLQSEPFDLRELLDHTVKMLALRAEQKNLELTYRVAAGVPDHLLGDPHRLRQVLVNLLGNAVKFTEAGTVSVEVGVEGTMELDNHVTLHFLVADTGIGIPEEKQRVIFQPFEQGDASATKRYEGTGLGLAIASQLIHLMGGCIWVHSTVGAGSQFHFTARFETSPVLEKRPAPADVSLPKPAARITKPVQPLRVLVTEDNPVNQLYVVDLLEQQGHTVLVASTGPEALALLEKESVDLLLLDVQMPEMSGFEVAARIREKEGRTSRRLPILALTAHAMKSDRDRCLAAGMDDFLAKPIRADELYAAIERRTAPRHPTTDNPKLRAKLSRVFLDVYPQWLEGIRTAVKQGDARTLGQTAHTLKGSVSHFDEAAAAAARRLEHMGADGDLSGVDDALASLEEALRRLHSILAEWSETAVDRSRDRQGAESGAP